MKILVAVDPNLYSSYVVHEVGRLVFNTWADIILIGIQNIHEPYVSIDNPLVNNLLSYRKDILSYYPDQECPYSKENINNLIEIKKNVYQAYPKGGIKKLKIIIRIGHPVKEILKQSEEEECDLIIIGCQKNSRCTWEEGDVPIKVANGAKCSVLVVKETKIPEQIVCCLDHDYVTQNSLELINQLVTLYQAELKIVGITKSDVLKQDVENRMKQLLEYYSRLKITPWLEVVDSSILHSFINQAAQNGLVALWMGPQSFLKKFFPKEKITNLIAQAPSSVLLLR